MAKSSKLQKSESESDKAPPPTSDVPASNSEALEPKQPAEESLVTLPKQRKKILLSARAAKKKADRVNHSEIRQTTEMIITEIETAIRAGEYETRVGMPMPEKLERELIRKGFKIEKDKSQDFVKTKISWSD